MGNSLSDQTHPYAGESARDTYHRPAPGPRRENSSARIPSEYAARGRPVARLDCRVVSIGTGRAAVNLHTAADRMAQFDSEERRLDDALARVRKRRQDAFTQELDDFELCHDPYGILGLDPGAGADEVNTAYRKLALKFHPDKVHVNEDESVKRQSEARFATITLAYVYLRKKLEQARAMAETKTESQMELIRKGRACSQAAPEQRQHVHLPRDGRFDIGKFNTTFDNFRLNDDTDGGYGDIMDKGQRQREDRPMMEQNAASRVFDGKFNRDVFNYAFDDCKRADRGRQVMVVDEPEALISGDLEYGELGRSRPDDYGRTSRAQNRYTDYKLAHTQYNTLIDPASVDVSDFKDIEQLKAARSNLSYDLSETDRKKLGLRKQREQLAEEERKVRQQERDEQVARHFEEVNRLMLR